MDVDPPFVNSKSMGRYDTSNPVQEMADENVTSNSDLLNTVPQ
jgi:hypothetical protein